ncbi:MULTISPECIES: hypothetical protein [Gallintestinimicrobium]
MEFSETGFTASRYAKRSCSSLDGSNHAVLSQLPCIHSALS